MKRIILVLLLLVPLCLWATELYTVNTQSKLNMRSGPGTSYGLVHQLSPGATVTLLEETGDGWVKIKYDRYMGYVAKNYLSSLQQSREVVNSSRSSNSSHYVWLLYTILGLLAFEIILRFFDAGIMQLLVLILEPILVIVYIHLTPNPMWYCSPSVVGWLLTCLNVFFTILILASCWGAFKGFFLGMFRGFDFISLLLACLFGYAVYLIVVTAFAELIIAGILMVIGAASGGKTFVGTFTDSDGNKWNAYR